ncbi:YceH family protein [Malikia sp.]|uniref:YceH family protein n=1 Tax=Malikia sp. TaxID=2070706 RepID=UPI00261C4A00|nr:YceH family protein [Malikia sp.]MDD2730338.1 YceH family protein [Malikia sp.]
MLNFESTPLNAAEARVLATLMEKARTVPDSYPLTLNSLQSGCNQKSSREPVMNLSEDEIAQAIDGLRERSLVFESSGGRTARYEHNFERAVGVPSQAAALLGLLLLRGPQTAGELRLNAERWHRFADIGSVEVFLEELQERSPDKGGPLVVKLERAPGAREQRWAQLLCGPVDVQAAASSAAPMPASTSANAQLQALAERVAALEALVAELRQRLEAAGA